MNTAIFSAIKSGDLQSLIVLFDLGLNILDEQLINEKGQTPVEFAIDMAKPTIFHFLINKQTEAIEKMQNQTEEYRNAKAILDKIRAKNSMNKNGLIEMSNGDKHWYFNNQLHREDGPAIEEKSGNQYWFKNGKLHREDGPAVVRINGEEKWYIDGIEIKEKIASEAQKKMKEKAYNQKISPQEKLQQLIIESKHIKILEEIALKNKLQENKEVSRLYINLLDEKDRVEPDILAKKEIIAKKMGYGLMNNREFYFSPQSKDYVYQLASFNIFKDYNKTLQQAQSGGIIFEWVLKKIFDLSNIMESGSHIDQSESLIYNSKAEYKYLFKIKPLPHFKSKAEMMIFATRYYFANFDNLKHLFLQVNKDNIKKTIIEDIKLIQSHGTREEIEQNIYTLFNYIYNSFIKDVKEQGYATSNRQEKNFYNEYTFNLFLDILKEDKTLLTQECYGDILSSLLNSENKSTVDKKDDIGFFMNLVQSSLNHQQMISIYAALVEHAKNIQAFNVANTFTTSDVSDEMLSYLLRYHFPKNILKSADLIKHASFMNFLKSESIHTCWKEIVLNLVDLKDFNTTEQDKLIEALLLDSSLMTLFKEQKDKLSMKTPTNEILYRNNTESFFLFYNKFKSEMSEHILNKLLDTLFKASNVHETSFVFEVLDTILTNPPISLGTKQVNMIADFIFNASSYEWSQDISSQHRVINNVFSHPLYIKKENKEIIAQHYYLHLTQLLSNSQLISKKLSDQEKLQVMQSIIDNPEQHPNFQYCKQVFESIISNNKQVIQDTYYKKYNALTYLVEALKTEAICTPFLDAYLKNDKHLVEKVDKNGKKPIAYVKRRKNIAEERVYDLLLNYGATVELSAFNKLMISFSSLFKEKSEFEYVASDEIKTTNRYEKLLEQIGVVSKNFETTMSTYHMYFNDKEFETLQNRMNSIYQNLVKIIDIAKKDDSIIEPEKLFYAENTINKYLPDSFNAFYSSMQSLDILDEQEKKEKIKYLTQQLNQQISILSMKTINITKDYTSEIVDSKILEMTKQTEFLKSKM